MKKKHPGSIDLKKHYLLAALIIGFAFSPQKAFGEENALPAKYDPRETGRVTPVKAQTRPICWSYAVTSAIESNLAKNGEQHNFSENYFNYLVATNATGIKGENPYSTVISNGKILDSVGGSSFPMNAILDWSGPVYESDFPNTITGYQPITKWQNLKAEKHIQGFVKLPSVSLDISKEDNDQRIKVIKQYVHRYGNAIQSNIMQRGYDGYYSSQYIPRERATGVPNHETTIVGWDDTFSKDVFVYTPSQDGAFIVKNSWGPNWGDQGYFYISYDDFQLKKSEVDIITSVENKDNYYKKYNVAHYVAGALIPLFPNKTRTLATSYSRTLDTPEQLSAVSLRTLSNDVKYEIYVMPNGKPSKNLAGFTKIQEGIKKEVGTETIRLKKPVKLTGKDFSIAVVYRSSDKEKRQELPVSPKEKIGLNKGNSHLLENDGSWTEESSRSFFISGFTERVSETKPISISVLKNNFSLLIGDQEQLSATLAPKNATYPSIGFRSLNPEFATVDSNGTITAVHAGNAIIEAFSTRNPSIKTSITVTVNDLPKIKEIQLSQNTLELKKYGTAQLTARTLPENAQPQKVIWSTSNPLIVGVDRYTGEVTWRQAGEVTITAATEDGSVNTSCKVSAQSDSYSNGHSFIQWATDSHRSSPGYLNVSDHLKDIIYFQYGAGFSKESKDNWVEFHLNTPKGKTFEAIDYPDISWFNVTNISDSITDSVIEYTIDGENFSSEKPAIKDLEGFRVHYAPKITSHLRLFVNLKLKVINLKEEEKRTPLLPIQLKYGYTSSGRYSRPTMYIVADGINPSGARSNNIYFAK